MGTISSSMVDSPPTSSVGPRGWRCVRNLARRSRQRARIRWRTSNMTPQLCQERNGRAFGRRARIVEETIEHAIPLLMLIDETFDIGADTRTPVDDSYEVPFRFAGAIDKLTFD